MNQQAGTVLRHVRCSVLDVRGYTLRRQTSIVLRCNEAHGTTIAIRQVCYLHNMVEQDHRAVKHLTRRMLGFKSFPSPRHFRYISRRSCSSQDFCHHLR
jgi:transposase-like protein